MSLEQKQSEILGNFPLRVALTDYCNLKCFFCSNEGMPICQKNIAHAEYSELIYLIDVLHRSGLKKLSLTGGEPSLYPKIMDLLEYIKLKPFKELFFHSNGVSLTPAIMDKLASVCHKIAVSIHGSNYATWQKMTGGTSGQFDHLLNNLEYLSQLPNRPIVELKYVVVKGKNDDAENILEFLNLCDHYGFKFKFLNFEPITAEQLGWNLPLPELLERLVALGCVRMAQQDDSFRGQCGYLPLNKLTYKNTWGVAIEIGCGDPEVCRDCYLSNEIFINSDLNIKPCHMDNQIIPLREYLVSHDQEQILTAIIKSREFLKSCPGQDKKIWNTNQ